MEVKKLLEVDSGRREVFAVNQAFSQLLASGHQRAGRYFSSSAMLEVYDVHSLLNVEFARLPAGIAAIIIVQAIGEV